MNPMPPMLIAVILGSIAVTGVLTWLFARADKDRTE
jgi:hypothetical protein